MPKANVYLKLEIIEMDLIKFAKNHSMQRQLKFSLRAYKVLATIVPTA